MKNISELVRSLEEARSNAPYNVKKNPTQEVEAAAKKLGYPGKVVGVSMTEVDKLGINPRSPYNTPLGIYSYPYRWIDYSKPAGVSIASFLPFQPKATYINVFSIKPSANVVNIGDAKQSEEIIKKIEDFLIDLIDADSAQIDEIRGLKNEFDDFWGVSYKAAKIYETISPRKRYGAAEAEVGDGGDLDELNKVNFSIASKAESVIFNLWEILFLDSEVEVAPPNVKKLSANQRKQLALKLQKSLSKSRQRSDDTPSVVKRRPLLWNKLMREVGVDVVIDMGYGKIHPSEENQMVIFNPSAIEKVIRIENVWQREKNPETKKEDAEEIIQAGLRKGTLTKRAAVQILQLPEDAIDEDLYTSTKYAKEFAAIKNAIRIFILKGSSDLFSKNMIREFDKRIKFVESRFGKLSLATITTILNKFDSYTLSIIDVDTWAYLFNLAMEHITPEQVNSMDNAAHVFFYWINFLSAHYAQEISLDERKKLLKDFFATDYWKKIENNGNLRSVKKQAQDFLNREE